MPERLRAIAILKRNPKLSYADHVKLHDEVKAYAQRLHRKRARVPMAVWLARATVPEPRSKGLPLPIIESAVA
jgi:hypothetical protein